MSHLLPGSDNYKQCTWEKSVMSFIPLDRGLHALSHPLFYIGGLSLSLPIKTAASFVFMYYMCVVDLVRDKCDWSDSSIVFIRSSLMYSCFLSGAHSVVLLFLCEMYSIGVSVMSVLHCACAASHSPFCHYRIPAAYSDCFACNEASYSRGSFGCWALSSPRIRTGRWIRRW